MRSPLAGRKERAKCLSRSDDGFIMTRGDLNAGAEWRGAVGTEMAMRLPERTEAIERVEKAAYARGRVRPPAVAVHAANPIIRN